MARNKKRRGRPSKQGVQRYPSGQIVHASREQRGETEVQAMATVVGYRKRQFKDEKDAKSPLAGFELGRMHIRKQITDREFQAGEYYTEAVADYWRIVGIPTPFPKAMDLFSTRGQSLTAGPSPEAVKRSSNTRNRLRTILGNLGRSVESAVDTVCLEDRETMSVEALKMGLQELGDFFGLEKEPVDARSKSA